MTADQLLAALQLADSAFPSGMYTQSHGLEAFVAAGWRGRALAPLLEAYLLDSAGPAEGVAARWANRAAAAGDLALAAEVDRRLDAAKLAEEGRVASRRSGGRVLQLGAELFPESPLPAYARRVADGEAPGHQAVAMGLLAAAAGLGDEEAALVELWAFASSLVSAAVRLAALDFAEAQRALLGLRPAVALAAEEGRGRAWQEIGGFAPEIEVMQMRHRYALEHMFVS